MGWFKDKINSAVSFVKENASAVAHAALDVAGFIPVVGTVADVANAALYAVEGDWKNAGLSALSAIPGIGDGIAAVAKSGKVVKAAKTITKIGNLANEAVGLYGDLKAAANGDLSGIGMRLLFASKGKIETGAASKKSKNKSDSIDEIKLKNKEGCVNGKCFTGDTLVFTKEGYIPIQNIRAGDDIYSRNEKTGETGFQKVEEVFLNHAHTIYTIEVDNKTKIQVTAYHPFYVEEQGWVNAISLQVGAKLQTMDGTATITNLKKERTEEAVPVYNFHVSEWVSYFVSELDVYVHNGNGHGNSIPSDEELKSAVEEWANMQKKLAPSKRKADNFNTASVAYDKKTGKYYYGMNNGVNISGDKKSIGLFGDGNVKGALPDKSLNDYRVGNCAEVDAVNQALNDNADMKDLIVTTIDTTPRNMGTLKPACENCKHTFKGKVAAMTAGYKGD